MGSLVSEFVEGFIHLFYPDICACCSTGLLRGESYVCGHCMHELPATGFCGDGDNPVAQSFWGRVAVDHAAAGYFFRKGNRIQKLVHQIKYQGQKEMGAFLGNELGKMLRDLHFGDIDIVAPVPLHPKKLRKRGYNQSEWIARGVAEALNKPIDTLTLTRREFSTSQTRKKRFDRWENVDSVFALTCVDAFAGKHILLIDDVITTGATLEACVRAVLTAPAAKASAAALAFATA
jgi:ComF family protein